MVELIPDWLTAERFLLVALGLILGAVLTLAALAGYVWRDEERRQ